MPLSLSYLPFHAEQAQVETNPERHATSYALVSPLVDFLPRPGYPYRVQWVAARAGLVSVLAGISTPVLIELARPTPQATLHIPVFGQGDYLVEGRKLISRAGETALYLPGIPHRSETSLCAGLSIGLDPQRLATTAAQLAGQPDAVDRYLPRFQQPQLVDRTTALGAHLVDHIKRVVGLIDLEPNRSFDLPAHLPLDRLIEKAVAVMVCPELVKR